MSVALSDEYYGCGDSGCIFGGPKGMSTNGGCDCLNRVKPPIKRVRIMKGILALRAQVRDLQQEVEDLRYELMDTDERWDWDADE